MKDNKDVFYMNKALELAVKAQGHTSPNPMVGCVIVKAGRIIGAGYHKKAGMPRAEIEALKLAGSKAKGASLYVNLEPCSHFGKTPPCADAIIKAGVKEVIAAMKDPNPLVSGRGFKKLIKAGIKVKTGVLNKEAYALNRIFIKNITTEKPFVIMKAAVSLDGKMALKNGESKWITSAPARKEAQKLRQMCDAILVGINTVINDNPFLDCRIDKSKKIKKVILDTNGRMPETGNIFLNGAPEDIYLAVKKMEEKKAERFRKKGINIIYIKDNEERPAPDKVLAELFCRGIKSVLLEGGGTVISSFLKEHLVDEAHIHIAPVIMGNDGIPFAGVFGFEKMDSVIRLKNHSAKQCGPDVLISGEVKYPEVKSVQRDSI
ncbi:MAG TPA: bifunctional diaminohydroxyphosphoribosylaminopyrimidine deaminase/5-amino-6-(5-phosphoribosylamino)uracil reductase RibD [Candidatus Goldiibacteriota bacterium]|nr:bifunctional diaminohydroxyphosphoribosylaminopyrimidine deaminase/5-amino-6-(5-phosphoribosylamino)uracil reductase RibD [Candidatus Goldiibacteriota bacterium]